MLVGGEMLAPTALAALDAGAATSGCPVPAPRTIAVCSGKGDVLCVLLSTFWSLRVGSTDDIRLRSNDVRRAMWASDR
jgi:hypothetical protein